MVPRSMDVALQWLEEGRRVVGAKLVETVGSAPLEPGGEMLVDDSGRIEGSVTGGCVEGALVEEAMGILAGAPPRVATYGISDEQAVGVGLMGAGTVRGCVHGGRARGPPARRPGGGARGARRRPAGGAGDPARRPVRRRHDGGAGGPCRRRP